MLYPGEGPVSELFIDVSDPEYTLIAWLTNVIWPLHSTWTLERGFPWPPTVCRGSWVLWQAAIKSKLTGIKNVHPAVDRLRCMLPHNSDLNMIRTRYAILSPLLSLALGSALFDISSESCKSIDQDLTEKLGLYFRVEDAPKPKARPADDGLSMLIQLTKDLQAFRLHGGYTGQQVLQTEKEDPIAAAAMMKKLEPYAQRAHLALTVPSAPYVFDYSDEKSPYPIGPASGLMYIVLLLRARSSLNLSNHHLVEANQDIEDIFRLANLVGAIPSPSSVQQERSFRAFALSEVASKANAYHDHPKERLELKEIIGRKRNRIPVIERVKTNAYFAVQMTRKNETGMQDNLGESTVKGQIQAYVTLAELANQSGDDFDEFTSKVEDLLRGIPADGSGLSIADSFSSKRVKEAELRKFFSLMMIGGMNGKAATVSGDLVSIWLSAESYRDLHRQFPPNLDSFGLSGLKDPFSNKGYSYLATSSSMSVWSVGFGLASPEESGKRGARNDFSLSVGSK